VCPPQEKRLAEKRFAACHHPRMAEKSVRAFRWRSDASAPEDAKIFAAGSIKIFHSLNGSCKYSALLALISLSPVGSAWFSPAYRWQEIGYSSWLRIICSHFIVFFVAFSRWKCHGAKIGYRFYQAASSFFWGGAFGCSSRMMGNLQVRFLEGWAPAMAPALDERCIG